MKHCLLACIVIMTMISCSNKEEARIHPAMKQKQKPITDLGVEAVKERVQTAANFIFAYHKKHGVFPAAESTPELKQVLSKDFKNDPKFDECWVSHNGKAYLVYSVGLGGKSLSSFSSKAKKEMKVIFDPVQVPPYGMVTVFLDGRMEMVVERPQAAAAGQM